MKRIGIIRRNGYGDVLCGIPLVLLCKKKFPEAKVSLFVDERSAGLVPYLEGPDEVVSIPEANNKYLGILKTIWQQRERFDLVISAKTVPMKLMNFFLYGLRAEKRVAYVDGSWHGWLINGGVPQSFEEAHQALKCLQLLDPSLEKIPEELYPRLKVPEEKRFFEGPTVFISVTNNRLGSTLDLDKYEWILNRLHETKTFSVVVNCEPKDVERAAGLNLKMPSRVVPTASFGEFMQVMKGSDVLFVGDGGNMHLAAALDKPQVVMFGGTKVWEWAPLSDKAICLSDAHNVNFIDREKILGALGTLL